MMHNHHPLVGRQLSGPQSARVTIRPVDDCARFNLRIDAQGLAAASSVWGSPLPASIGELTVNGSRLAACIGPDEWFLIAPLDEQASIESGFAQLYSTTIHSLVDVGHREVGIAIEGAQAVEAVQACIAFDVARMKAGGACRTIIDKAQIILLREADDRFRIEVWHSFSDHVWHLLDGICREINLGV